MWYYLGEPRRVLAAARAQAREPDAERVQDVAGAVDRRRAGLGDGQHRAKGAVAADADVADLTDGGEGRFYQHPPYVLHG